MSQLEKIQDKVFELMDDIINGEYCDKCNFVCDHTIEETECYKFQKKLYDALFSLMGES